MAIVRLSKHSELRMKQRCGLNKRSQQRMADKAYQQGISFFEAKGKLKHWLSLQYFNGQCRANAIKVYGDKCYIFRDKTLITVLQIPPNVMRNKLAQRPMEGDALDGNMV